MSIFDNLSIRERFEKREVLLLSKKACLSVNSKGRKTFEEKCSARTDFQRDRDRILYSKAFKRLKHKTQCFIYPEGDYFRTRLTHTLEVTQIGRSIARALNLNEDLTEAIGLGHDLGHAPFGHAGEEILDSILTSISPNERFRHNEQSLRVVDYLENDRKGLNLTYEVRDGILKHTKGRADLKADDSDKSFMPETLEGRIIRISDRVGYLNHDIDDSIMAGIIKESELPKEAVKEIGSTSSQRLNALISDIINMSTDKDDIYMSDKMYKCLNILKDFMFERVYTDPYAKLEEVKARRMLESMFEYFRKNTNKIPKDYLNDNISIERSISDYISGMSDSFAIYTYEEIFIPKVWDFSIIKHENS